MIESDAWEIYDAQAGKQGRPSAEFKEAKLWLIEKELLSTEDTKSSKEKKDKKPPLELSIINNPFECSIEYQKEIYLEGLKYISDKRNFDFDYYLIGRYGLTRSVCTVWETKSEEVRKLRSIASELMEHKLLDSVNDKWSGGNPIGNMLTLKAVYGYNDRGDGGSLMVDGNIEIQAVTSEDDFDDIDYEEADGGFSEEIPEGYDNEDSQ